MANTPNEAIQDHLAAVNAGDHQLLAASTTFPLFQGGGDGGKSWYQTPEDVPFPVPPNRLDLRSERVIASNDAFKLFSLDAAVISPDGDALRQIEMLWAVHRVDGQWKVGWRQFIG